MKQRQILLYGYAAVITAAGCTFFGVTLKNSSLADVWGSSHFWLLAVGVVLGEFVHIKVPHRDETVSVTVGDPFTLALLFTFGLAPAMLVKTFATLLEDIWNRKAWWKALFNVGQFSLSLGVGSWIFGFSGYAPLTSSSLDVQTVAVALAGAFAYFLVNMLIVTTAISMSIGESPLDTFRANLAETGVIQQLALTAFTPVVTSAVHDSAALFPLLLVPIVVVYRSGLLVQRHATLAEQLRELYEATRITNTKMGTREATRHLLERVCHMFDAESAAITLLPPQGSESGKKAMLDVTTGSFTYQEEVSLDPTRGLWARVASENQALILSAPIENEHLQKYFAASGIKDVMAAPLRSEDAVSGVLEIFNRRPHTVTFSEEDLGLFQTLANHASVAIDNSRLIEELETSLVHLTEMNRLKDDFVASVSHELRTPLTSIQGFVKTLLRTDAKFSATDQRSFLETVDRQSGRLHRLIEDLLAVSRIESRTDATKYSVVSLKEIAQHVIDEVHNRASEGQIEIDFDGDLPVETDGDKVHQIVSNLLDNGLKYGGGHIIIRGRRDGDGASVSVLDSGPGVPPEMQDKIFDRFYQVDQSATRSVGGAGLGLYICRRMAQAVGGRVWLETTGPEGSTFTVWVPSSPVDTVESAVPFPVVADSAWKV